MYICIHIMYIRIYRCAYIYIYIYIFIYRERGGGREREREIDNKVIQVEG